MGTQNGSNFSSMPKTEYPCALLRLLYYFLHKYLFFTKSIPNRTPN